MNSMHERKAEMARRSCAFIGLPGGFGTFEEVRRSSQRDGVPCAHLLCSQVLEMVCWSQIGIQSKRTCLAFICSSLISDPIPTLSTAVLLLNVHGFWDPLKHLVQNGIESGFILRQNERLVRYVDGPADHTAHDDFDWGKAAIDALDSWEAVSASHFYNWHLRKEGEKDADSLGAA